MKKYSLYILFLMGLGAMAGSCTNLDEKIYDRLVDNNFYKMKKISLLPLHRYIRIIEDFWNGVSGGTLKKRLMWP
mgnify:CR=1 FL=1